MNVLFMTHAFPRSDGDVAGSFILRLARALADEGIFVHVLAPGAAGLLPRAVLDGIPVRRFRYAPRRLETLAYGGTMASQVSESWGARLSLIGFVGAEIGAGVRAQRSVRPALVHAHWWLPNGVAAACVARIGSIPMMTTMHGTDVRMARRFSQLRPAFRHVLGRSARVTTVSRWLADETESMVPSCRPLVAPMPVAAERFAPGARTDERSNLLFVGWLMQQKGVDVLLDALALLPDSIRLDVVGDGPERESLQRKAAQLDVQDRVVWHGVIRPDAIAPFYQRAAALVVPSTEEGLGLVAVEAQLCETPVVAFASGGLLDVVEHDHTGLLVDGRTAAALALAIQTLFARADRGAALGVEGRTRAAGTFSPDAVGRRYAGIYRDIVASRAS